MNRLSKSLLAMLLVVVTGVAVAGHGGHGERHFERLSKKLDLTAEQQTKIEAIRESTTAQKQALRDEKKAIREAMKAMMASDNYNQGAVEELATRKGELVRKKMILKAETMQAISQVLSPEQRAKAKKMMQKHGKKKMRHHRKMADDSE